MTMPLEKYAALFLVGLSVLPFLSCVSRFRTWFRIKGTVTVPIKDVATNLTVIKGRVVTGGRLLKSPVTGEPCAYFKTVVRDRNRGKIIHRRVSSLPIHIEDTTGTARIELRGAVIDLKPTVSYSAGFMAGGFPRQVCNYLESKKIKRKIIGIERDMHLEETYIPAGKQVYVLGYGAKFDDQVYFYKRNPYPLIITDRRNVVIATGHFKKWMISAAAGIYMVLMGLLLGFM